MLQKTNPQVVYCREHSCLSTDCICGAKMRLRFVQPHLLADLKVDVCVFECDECLHELRVIRPRDIQIAR
jgi:hypothetical protein